LRIFGRTRDCRRGVRGECREAWAKLGCDFNDSNIFTAELFVNDGQILDDSDANVFERFRLGRALRPAARKAGHRCGKAFLRTMKRNLVLHRNLHVQV